MRSLAAAQCRIVVDVGYLVANIGAVVFIPFDPLWVYQSLMLGLYTVHTPRIIGVVPVLPLLHIMSVHHILLRQTLMRNCLPLEESVDIVFESRILADQFIQQFLVLVELALQILAVAQIDLALEFIDIGALIEQRLNIPEEIVDAVHALLVARVDELADSGLEAYSADIGVPGLLLAEAVHAEEAVAVEDKLTDLSEARLAFVPVLRVLVHNYTNFSHIIISLMAKYVSMFVC